MAPKQLRYDRMIDDAFRGVVRNALGEVAKNGLPGEHHFYISFHTAYPGVDIPESLFSQYPDTMTIVLQYQYWGLEVDDKKFAVTLSFNNRNERLTVPLAAVTEFTDPSVGFKLTFQARQEEGVGADEVKKPRDALRPVAAEHAQENADDKAKSAQVVTLDAFRKK